MNDWSDLIVDFELIITGSLCRTTEFNYSNSIFEIGLVFHKIDQLGSPRTCVGSRSQLSTRQRGGTRHRPSNPGTYPFYIFPSHSWEWRQN